MPFTEKFLKSVRKKEETNWLISITTTTKSFFLTKTVEWKKEVIQTGKTAGYIHSKFAYIRRVQ